MAAKMLLPGYGSQYVSEAFTSSSTVGDDTLDCSRVKTLTVQIISTGSATGNIDLQRTFDGSNWLSMGHPFNNMALTGDLFFTSTGAFGRIRINATDVTAGTLIVTITGWEEPCVP